jgi:hypothetical protein
MKWCYERGVFVPIKKISGQAAKASEKSSEKRTSKNAAKGRTSTKLPEKVTLERVSKKSKRKHQFEKGDIVAVAERVWPGSNKLGGIGKVIDSRLSDEGTLLYDIQYFIGKEKDINVEEEYVEPHEFGSRQTRTW